MSKDKKRLVPVRRFKEFENADAWEQRKLGDVVNRFDNLRIPVTASKRIHGEFPYYGANGIQDYVDGYTHNGEYILVAEDGASNVYDYPVNYVKGKVWVNNHAHVIQGKTNIADNLFLLNAIKSINIASFLVGGSRAKLNAEIMMELPIKIPSYNEQKKIGKYFANIDSLITLHQRKLDKLKRVKSAYLTEMFPAEGEREPKRRFPGFTGAWEQRKLGEVVEITMGQSPSSKNYTENPNDHILVQGNADMKNGHVVPRVWTTQITKQAEKGDLILSVRAPVGDIGKTDYDVVLGRGVAAIKGNSFIFQLLTKMKINGYWTRFSTGSTFESINSDNIKNAQISIPSLREQEKIGGLFNEFDSLIALHQRKLDKLKKMKAAYLEEMFV